MNVDGVEDGGVGVPEPRGDLRGAEGAFVEESAGVEVPEVVCAHAVGASVERCPAEASGEAARARLAEYEVLCESIIRRVWERGRAR